MQQAHLTTSRLLLRPIHATDAKAVFAYRSDAITNQYQGSIPKILADIEAFIAKTATSFNRVDTWFQVVIIEQESDELIGDVGLHFIDEEQVEIGCTLAKAYHNKGYATEALCCVVNYLFNEHNKHRIVASIDPANTASIKLVERLGFRKEAHFIESICLNGNWVDDVVYAVFKTRVEDLVLRRLHLQLLSDIFTKGYQSYMCQFKMLAGKRDTDNSDGQ